MLPKSGSRLPERLSFSDLEIADVIGRALTEDLGGSRRATKTVMKWAEVSDRAARAWINGESCPSCRHLIILAAKSRTVMSAILQMAGHDQLMVALDLDEIEAELVSVTDRLRRLRQTSALQRDGGSG